MITILYIGKGYILKNLCVVYIFCDRNG